LKLLLDHNLSPRLARALGALFVDHQIVALRDKFPENIADIDWILELDRDGGWGVLTKDLRISGNRFPHCNKGIGDAKLPARRGGRIG